MMGFFFKIRPGCWVKFGQNDDFSKGLCDFKSVGRPRSRSEIVIARRLKISGLVGLGHGI